MLRIIEKQNDGQNNTRLNSSHYNDQRKDGHVNARFSAHFIVLTFENMNNVFFYEIQILIKTKNINICCFQVITDRTNYDYIFQ